MTSLVEGVNSHFEKYLVIFQIDILTCDLVELVNYCNHLNKCFSRPI